MTIKQTVTREMAEALYTDLSLANYTQDLMGVKFTIGQIQALRPSWTIPQIDEALVRMRQLLERPARLAPVPFGTSRLTQRGVADSLDEIALPVLFSTLSLMHFDTGAVLVDEVGGTVTNSGSSSTTDSRKILGTESVLFSNAGQYLENVFNTSYEQIADGGPWTIEVLYKTTLQGQPNKWGTRLMAGAGVAVEVEDNYDGTVDVHLDDDSETLSFSGLGTVSSGVVRYCVVQYDGTDIRVWVNGTEATEGGQTPGHAPPGGIDSARLQCTLQGANNSTGDEWRITRGARYTDTPPEASVSTPFALEFD